MNTLEVRRNITRPRGWVEKAGPKLAQAIRLPFGYGRTLGDEFPIRAPKSEYRTAVLGQGRTRRRRS